MFSPTPRSDASALYLPVHRRTLSSSTLSSLPSPSALPHRTLPTPGVYTPAELLLLSASPLATLSPDDVDALRAHAPEVVQTRKQRKARAWHAHHHPGTSTRSPTHTHTRASSCGSHHSSESEEDRATTWRRV